MYPFSPQRSEKDPQGHDEVFNFKRGSNQSYQRYEQKEFSLRSSLDQ